MLAGAAQDTPTGKIARLRARAARVQAAIDRMNAQIERLVEDYNQVREALAQTRVEQARTHREVVAARRRRRAARRQLGARLWAIFTGGAPSTLGQLLGAEDIHQALVTTRYQEQVVAADRAALDRVERLRRQVEARLAAQRRYHQRLTSRLRRAVAEERRRQEALRRRALLRRLAAERAASWASRTCGADGPSAYDCSGLVMAAYRRAGVWLPRVSREQRGHDRGPVFRGQRPRRLHRPPPLHRRRPADRVRGSGGRKGRFLLDFEGRDPRGPTPRLRI